MSCLSLRPLPLLLGLSTLPACLPELPDDPKVDTAVDTASDTADSAPAGSAPVVSNVRLDPADPRTNDVLRVTFDAVDPDGDTLFTAIAWTVNGARVEGQTGAELDGATWFDRDDVVGVTVSVSDGSRATEAGASVGVANTAPSAPGVAITPSEPIAGQALACAVGTESVDADGDAMTYGYSWTVDGVDAGVSGPSVDAARTRAGEMWTCRVTGSDGSATGEAGTASVGIARGECLPAYLLGSSSGYATIANSSGGDFDFGSSLTVSVWVKVPSGALETTTYIIGNSAQDIDCPGMAMSVGSDGSVNIGLSNGSTYLYCAGDCDGAGFGAVSSGMPRGEWHNVAFVQDASVGMYVYVDGVLETLDTCSRPIDVMDPVRDMRVGRPLYYTRAQSTVAIADLAFWSRALTEEEVAGVSAYSGASAAIALGLVASIQFNEGVGNVAADVTGNHNVEIDAGAVSWITAGPNCP